MRIYSGSPSNFSKMEREMAAKKSVGGSAPGLSVIGDERQSLASSLVSGTSIGIGGL